MIGCVFVEIYLTNLRSDDKYGIYWILTSSGTTYELHIDKTTLLKRIPKLNKNSYVHSSLRKDNNYIEVVADFDIVVGASAIFILKGLGHPPFTKRITTTVVKIYTFQEMR